MLVPGLLGIPGPQAAPVFPFAANSVGWWDSQYLRETNPVTYLDGTQIFANGSPVGAASWLDRSGSGRNSSDQGLGSVETLRTASNSLLNGKDSIFYDSAGIFVATDGISGGSTNFVQVFVCRYTSAAGDKYLAGCHSDNNSSYLAGFESGGGVRMRYLATGTGGYFTTGPTMADMLDVNKRVIVRVTGGFATLFVDGVKYDSIAFSPSGAWNARGIGAGFYGGGSRAFAGYYGERNDLVRDPGTPWTDAEMYQIDDYLQLRWGL